MLFIKQLNKKINNLIGLLQCDQIWLFFKGLINKYPTRVAQIFAKFVDSLEKHPYLILNYFGYFYGNFGENWATFYSNIWSHWLTPNYAERAILPSNIFDYDSNMSKMQEMKQTPLLKWGKLIKKRSYLFLLT